MLQQMTTGSEAVTVHLGSIDAGHEGTSPKRALQRQLSEKGETNPISSAEEVMAEVLIEMAFCANNASMFKEASAQFMAALLITIGKEATELLVDQTGLTPQLDDAFVLVNNCPASIQGPTPSPIVSRTASERGPGNGAHVVEQLKFLSPISA